jgi:integrase
MNTQPITTETGCNIIPFPTWNIKTTEQKRSKGQPIVANVIKDEKEFISHAADAITDKEKLNSIILEAYLNGDISKITAFIFGINTGFRVSDILDIRVQDIATDGKINDWYAVREQKTSKPRQIWLNDTVKKALEFLIEYRDLQPIDYLFVADKQPHLWKHVDLNNAKYLETGKPDDARVDYE